jgi:hypothetical protein
MVVLIGHDSAELWWFVQGGLVPSTISGVGTNYELLVHVLPGPNEQRALKVSILLSLIKG